MAEDKTYTLEELKKKLTHKERIFCHEYIVDWNGARSARVAGYSEDTAREIASQNLTKAHIQQYIAFIKDNLEEEAGISKLKQLKTLLDIAEDEKSNTRDKISAVAELNKMLGYNNPEKVEHSGSVIIVKPPKFD